MKYFITFSTLFITFFLQAQSNNYTVSNLTGSVANFNNLQKAVDSVPAGSIIYLQPSSISYGKVIVKKRITIFGNGYFLGQNAAPFTQANLLNSSLINITFKPGSDGSLISGLSFLRDDGSIPEIEFDTVSNIIIERSLFKPNERHFAFLQSSNINIRQNYFSGSDYLVSTSYLFYANSNPGVKFNNNIFNGGILAQYNTDYSNITFDHNTILTYDASFNLYNINFTNNLFFKHSQSAGDTLISFGNNNGPAGSCQKNITNYGTLFNAQTNKVYAKSYLLDSLINTRINTLGITSDDGLFTLKTNSFAKTYSTDNTECGAFGGTTPYILSGLPPIPNIYNLSVTENGTTLGGLKINIKVSANN